MGSPGRRPASLERIIRNFRFQLYLCAQSYASRPLVPSSHRHAQGGALLDRPPAPRAQIAPKKCKRGGGTFRSPYLLSPPPRFDGVSYTKEKSATPHHQPEGATRQRRRGGARSGFGAIRLVQRSPRSPLFLPHPCAGLPHSHGDLSLECKRGLRTIVGEGRVEKGNSGSSQGSLYHDRRRAQGLGSQIVKAWGLYL